MNSLRGIVMAGRRVGRRAGAVVFNILSGGASNTNYTSLDVLDGGASNTNYAALNTQDGGSASGY